MCVLFRLHTQVSQTQQGAVPPPPVTPTQVPPLAQGVGVSPVQTAGPDMSQQQQIAAGAPSLPVNINQPGTALLQGSLQQAFGQDQNTSTITMDDVANFMLPAGRPSV